MSQKGFAPILIVLILAGVMLFVPLPRYQQELCNEMDPPTCYPSGWKLGFSLWDELTGKPIQTSQKPVLVPSPQPTIQPSPSPDETANWKTYTNSEYDYQLKYPEKLSTKIPENAPEVFIIYLSEKGEYLQIQIQPLSSFFGLDKQMEFDMQRANPSKTTFQNKPAVSTRPARNIYPGEPFKAVVVYVEDKKFKIELGYYGYGTNEALYDQILSTFKFTQ